MSLSELRVSTRWPISIKAGAACALVALLVLAAAGCSGRGRSMGTAAPEPLAGRTSAATATARASEASAGPAVASSSDLASLVNQLGAFSEDPMKRARLRVLEHTDLGPLLHSMAPAMPKSQAPWRPRHALAQLDKWLASKGATRTYDMIVSADWGDQTSPNWDAIGLSNTIGVLGVFDESGVFAKNSTPGMTYRMTSTSVTGDLGTVHYVSDQGNSIDVVLELRREASGELRIVGWPNFGEVVGKLGAKAISSY